MRNAILIAALLAGHAAAQEAGSAQPVSVYRLQFAVHELENSKRVSTKNYTMLVQNTDSGRINAGTRVPLPSGGPGAGPNQFQYYDIGLNLRCRVHERESQVLLNTEVSISNISAEAENRPGQPPTIRQISSTVGSVVHEGKPTTIITLDDPATRRRYEVEVTATRVK